MEARSSTRYRSVLSVNEGCPAHRCPVRASLLVGRSSSVEVSIRRREHRETHAEGKYVMTEQQHQVGGGRKSIGDIAPKLAELTDDVLFEDVWNRERLSARDRSLITCAVLIAGGDSEQLKFHLGRAKENGVTEGELIEAITHLAFYAGWPKAMTAANVAKQVFGA